MDEEALLTVFKTAYQDADDANKIFKLEIIKKVAAVLPTLKGTHLDLGTIKLIELSVLSEAELLFIQNKSIKWNGYIIEMYKHVVLADDGTEGIKNYLVVAPKSHFDFNWDDDSDI